MHVYKQSNRSSNAVGCGQRGARRVLPLAPRAASKETSADKTSSLSSVDIDPDALLRASPNSASRLFGFGMSPQWFEAAPRVRVRNADTKQLEELVELAVLNERLSGRLEPWQARRKLEYLRTKRKNWERIFEYITSQDVEATLAAIEEANLKVEATLNAESTRERTGVGALKAELTALQADVIAAQARLADTQTRVEQELERVNALRQEAMALERVRTSVSAPEPVAILAPPALAPTITTTPTIPASPQQTSSPTASPVMEAAAARSTAKRSGSGQKGSKAGMGRDRGLKSSLELEEPLRQHWYAAEFSSRLGKDVMVPFDIFDEPWVLFRDAEGKAGCVKDECAHRACPLSIGKVENGEIVCPYHGWAYDNKGSCTKMPSTPFCKGIQVKALPCVEKDGFVWIWPGKGDPPMDQLPNTLPPEGFDIHAEIFVDVPVEHGLLIENLLDLAHAPFTHTSTFARGWPVPDAVKFHATKLLSGNWDPYPINMAFMPPCITVSMIGLSQPGQIRRGVTAEQCDKHLHQLHVCMPSKKGHTRLLYRMSLDFIPWLRNVPFIDRVWKRVAAQVLGEDLVLVLGQQDRLMRGGDTWRHPVSYDKLAVRYRRWRNELARGNPTGAAAQLSEAKMSAGEMFACEEVAAVEGAGEGRDMCDYAMYDSALEEADRMDSMQMVNESRN